MPEPEQQLSVIISATVRVAGELPYRITITDAGTESREASLRLGEVLLYVRDHRIAGEVSRLWRQSAPIIHALPHGVARPLLPARGGRAGLFARLAGYPPCTIAWVPGRAGTAYPPHVRAEIGPLVFEVCNQRAWHCLARAWDALHRQLATTASVDPDTPEWFQRLCCREPEEFSTGT